MLNPGRDWMVVSALSGALASITAEAVSDASRNIGESFVNAESGSAVCTLSVFISKADRKLDTEGWPEGVCACSRNAKRSKGVPLNQVCMPSRNSARSGIARRSVCSAASCAACPANLSQYST